MSFQRRWFDLPKMNEWSNLWEKGQVTTFAYLFPNGYIEGFIGDWLDSLELGDDILEVGCGNASLVPYLQHRGVGKNYTGVDSAKIQLPEMQIKNLNITLHKETKMEDTSFIGKFDQVVSIYGLEYTYMFRTLPLVYESLKKNGQIHLMLHNTDSPITRYARKQLSTHYSINFKSTGNLVDDFKSEKIRHKKQIEVSRDKNEIEVFKCNLEKTGFTDIKITEQEQKFAWLISAKRL